MSQVEEYEPDLVCLGLLDSHLEGARDAMQSQLEKTIRKGSFRSAQQKIDWQHFFENHGQFYEIKRFQIALLPVRSDLTAYVCNLADGWISLFGNLVGSNGFDAYFFRATLAEIAEYKAFEMKAWRNGALKRHISVLQDDDGWKFVNRGSPMAIESPMQYEKRQIGDRLNRRLIQRYSEAAGFRICAVARFRDECWRFWREQ